MQTRTLGEAWQTRAACRGPQSAVFFPPTHAERKEDKIERENRAKDICAFDADRVHYRSYVVGALFEGGHFDGPIGKPGGSLVESNQATKSAEPLEEKRAPGYLPVEVEVRHRSRRHNHIDGAFACYLVGNQHIVTAGVLRLGQQLIFGHGVGGVVSSARLAIIC